MGSAVQAGRWMGGLMLLHLACGLIGPYLVLVPLTAPPAAFLESAAPIAGTVRGAVCVLTAAALLPIFMAVLMEPVLAARNWRLFPWLVTIAGVHGALQLVESSHWLTLLSVSEAYQQAGEDARSGYAVAGVVARSAFKWAHYAHILALVSWILVSYVAFLRARLVPPGLAAAGIAAALLHAIGIPLAEFIGYRVPSPSSWGIPLALVHLATGVWLSIRGFAPEPDVRPRANPAESWRTS